MGKCINCNGECTQLISDGCVRYEGEAFECIDLNEGTFDNPVFYREAFDKLASGFCDFLAQNNVDLSCLYDGDGNPTAPVKEAVEKLIAKVCNLSTDDIQATASSYAVGSNSSVCGAKLLNRSLNWATTNIDTATQFTYNFSNAVSNLPDNYSVNNVSVKAIGKSSGSVNTIFANSDKRSAGFNIPPNRLPVIVDATVNIDTPCGQISLNKKIGISSAQEGAFTTPLDIIDTSSTTNLGGKTLTQYLEDQSSQISINKNEIESLKDVSVQGCDNVNYPSQDIQTVVQVQGGKVCEALGRLDRIGSETVLVTTCDDQCGVNTSESSLQSALDQLSEIICDNQKEIAQLKSDLRDLQLIVQSCCDVSSSTAGASSGSGSGGGGCSGGDCPDGNFNTGDGTGIGGSGTITGTPNGGNGSGNGSPATCNESPITFDYTYDCISGLSYTVTGTQGLYTVTVNGQPATQGILLPDGTHVFKVVDSRGCEAYGSRSINCCSVDFTSNYDCEEGLTVTISGGSGNTTTTVDGNTYTQGMSLTNGSHTIKVVDNTENCSVSKIKTVNCDVDDCAGITISVTPDAADYCTTQSVEVDFTGGTAPYSISIGGVLRDTGVSSSPKTVAASGYSNETIEVLVTDVNGCTGTSSVYIPSCCDNSTLNIFANIPSWECSGTTTHILNVGVVGGSPTYSIEVVDGTMATVYSQSGLSPSANYAIDTGLSAATTYTITVTDSQGCTDTYQIPVDECS